MFLKILFWGCVFDEEKARRGIKMLELGIKNDLIVRKCSQMFKIYSSIFDSLLKFHHSCLPCIWLLLLKELIVCREGIVEAKVPPSFIQ